MNSERLLSRRKFLGGALGSAGALFFSSRCIDPFWPEFNIKRVALPYRLKNPIRILHVSDIHAFDAMPFWYFENVFHLALRDRPDLICLTGDFISRNLPDPRMFARILQPFSTAAPVYACLGNHDGGGWAGNAGGYKDPGLVRQVLNAASIRCLENELVEISVAGQQVGLFGTVDLWTAPIDGTPLLGAPAEIPKIVLAHNPDTKDELAAPPWDLMLSGHSHGGQFTYPLTGGTPFCVVNDKRYISGLNRWGNRWIHTSRGVGTVAGIRVNCPPEVTLLEIVGTAV